MKKWAFVFIAVASILFTGCVWCEHEVVTPHTVDKGDIKLIGLGYTKRESDCCYVEIDSTFYTVDTIYMIRGNGVGFITVKPVEDLYVTVVDFQDPQIFGRKGIKYLLGIWDEAKIDSVFIHY